TTSGYPLLGDGGPIVIEPEETSITIAADGTVLTSEGPKGRIRVVQFADDAALTKQGRNLYASDEVPLPADNVRIRQGAVEGSNVEAVREMSRMIEVVRSYVSTSKLLGEADELQRRAIEQLGRLPA